MDINTAAVPSGQLVLEAEREVVEALFNNHYASALYKAKNYWLVVEEW